MALLNLSFESNDPFNSTITDSATGEPVFVVETPSKFVHRETTIRSPDNEVLAVYVHKLGRDTVTYHGDTRTVTEWMPRKSVVSKARTFVAPSGQVYTWKRELGGSFKLLDALTQAVAAETHTPTIFSSRRKRSIDVMDKELLPYIDAVVVSFLVCEREKRKARSA